MTLRALFLWSRLNRHLNPFKQHILKEQLLLHNSDMEDMNISMCCPRLLLSAITFDPSENFFNKVTGVSLNKPVYE